MRSLLHPHYTLPRSHNPDEHSLCTGYATHCTDAYIYRWGDNNHEDGWGGAGLIELWSWGIEFPGIDALLRTIQLGCLGKRNWRSWTDRSWRLFSCHYRTGSEQQEHHLRFCIPTNHHACQLLCHSPMGAACAKTSSRTSQKLIHRRG